MSKLVIAIIPQTDRVPIGNDKQEEAYRYSDPKLADLLQDPSTVKVFADAVEGQTKLGQNGLEVEGEIFDIKLADSLPTAGLGSDNSYPSISERYLNKLTSEPTTQDLLSLRGDLRQQLADEKLIEVAKVEFDATKATAQMSQNGVRLDTAWLRDRQVELQEEQKVLDTQLKEWLGDRNPDRREAISSEII